MSHCIDPAGYRQRADLDEWERTQQRALEEWRSRQQEGVVLPADAAATAYFDGCDIATVQLDRAPHGTDELRRFQRALERANQ